MITIVKQVRQYLPCVMAIALGAASSVGYAAEAQVGVRTYASDTPSGVQFTENTAGSPASGFTTASRVVDTVAGNASAHAEAQADALSGVIREKLNANVAASQYVIGRSAGGYSIASMSGSINLVGPATPGMATFTAVLEGSYNIQTPSPFNYQSLDNSINMQYTFAVGNSPQFNNGYNDYFFCCTPGTFSIPFSWSQTVNAGDSIRFDFYLRSLISDVAGSAQFDASNTFKVTGINLPGGYSFTSDSGGFLSQFDGAVVVPTVPEPETWLLLGVGLLLIETVRRRKVA